MCPGQEGWGCQSAAHSGYARKGPDTLVNFPEPHSSLGFGERGTGGVPAALGRTQLHPPARPARRPRGGGCAQDPWAWRSEAH